MSKVSDFAFEALQQQNRQLREQIEEQAETIRQYRDALASERNALPDWLPHLTRTERCLLTALKSGRLVSKASLMTIMYGHRLDEIEPVIVNVYVCKLRKKLAGTGVEIENVWGQGYRLTPASVALLASAREAAA